MNLVLDGAFEVDVKKGTRKEIGTCSSTNFMFMIITICVCLFVNKGLILLSFTCFFN